MAQTARLTDHVTTSNGKSAAFVNVILEGTKRGATADENGYYEIGNLTAGTYTLSATFVGLMLKVETEDKAYNCRIEWTTAITPQLIGATRDKERTTEWAAMGLALLLVRELTEYLYICTSQKRTGIDFFLSRNANEMARDARLEISGIRKESPTNTLKRRLIIKKRQTEPSDASNKPVFISITEFSEPQSLFIKK